MAIKEFKEIVDRKGYLVESEDRKIFEQELTKSNYGLGCNDMIEFILYDSNDNQLPQGEEGKLVRYISTDDEDYKKYFLNLPKNPYTNKINDSEDYMVDLQQLILDSGYNNGIFKTQVTFLNRRIGSEVGLDKTWIHEISPSRTEVRILPLKNKATDEDLQKRYSVFTDKKQFRDDIIYNIREYVDSINLDKIKEFITFRKGTESDGKQYINLIKKEFKINDFDIFLLKIRDKWIESIKYYVDGYGWDINNINYGKPLGNKQECIELSLKELQSDLETSLINIIDKFLFKRDIIKDSILTKEEQITLDKVKDILKTTTVASVYETSIPDSISGVVRGCTDPNSKNYNPEATEDDGSCLYEEEDLVVKGCTDPTSLNYNPLATVDDGSCEYAEEVNIVKKKYYIWSDRGEINYVDKNGVLQNLSGVEFDSFTVVHQVKKVTFIGDVREVPKITRKKTTYFYRILNQSSIKNYRTPNYDRGYNDFDFNENDIFRERTYGNTFTSTYNFEDSGAGILGFKGQPIAVSYKDELGNTVTSLEIEIGGSITVCAQEGSISEMPGIKVIKGNLCGEGMVTQTPITPSTGAVGGGGSGGGGGQIGEVLQVIEPTDGAPLPGRNDAPIFRGNIK